MRKNKRKICFVLVLAIMLSCLGVDTTVVSASSGKSKALKAYNKYLSTKTIKWNSLRYPKENFRFSLAYIDRDNVPELILNCDGVCHYEGYQKVYTFKNGKVKELATDDVIFYYPKTGIFISRHYGMGGEFFVYKLSKVKTIRKLRVSMPEAVKELGEKTTYYSYAPKYKKITKKQYEKELKKLVKNKKKKSGRFYHNTKKNRNKILR